jgi:hypothetical protein
MQQFGETGRLVGEKIRARLKWAVMKWLGVQHLSAILAAAVCLGQGQIVKVCPQIDTCLRSKNMKIRVRHQLFTLAFFALVLSALAVAPFLTLSFADNL